MMPYSIPSRGLWCQTFHSACKSVVIVWKAAVDISPKLLSALIGAIYDCALDPAKWENALGEMVAALECKNALLSLTDMRYDRLLLTRNFGMNEEWWRSFQDKHVPEVAAQLSAILASWPLDKPFVISRDLPSDTLQGSGYVEAFRSEGIVDVLQCFLIGSPKRFAGLALTRLEPQGIFADRDVELAGLLLPHIRRAVTISDLLDVQALERTHFTDALNALRCAVILTDVSGKIVHANRSAETMLRDAKAIRDQRGILQAVLTPASRELSQAIELAAKDDFQIGKTGLAVRLSEDDSSPVIAHVLPLATSELRSRFEPAAIAAVFIRNQEDTRDNAELLATTYALTPAETRVLSCVLAGRSLDESTSELRIAATTFRTHLYAIFRKTGVSRQQDLLLLASQLSPPAEVI
jgi:DNA-binding CsgD family transcriptional regulator/PAS domain-containing protein